SAVQRRGVDPGDRTPWTGGSVGESKRGLARGARSDPELALYPVKVVRLSPEAIDELVEAAEGALPRLPSPRPQPAARRCALVQSCPCDAYFVKQSLGVAEISRIDQRLRELAVKLAEYLSRLLR